jgi:hypothetical protein
MGGINSQFQGEEKMTAHDDQAADVAAEAGFAFTGLHHTQLAIPPGGEDLARRYYAKSSAWPSWRSRRY